MFESLKKPAMIFICFALTASTLLVFWQVRTFDFVNYDDDEYVYNNQHVSGGLTPENILSAFTTAPSGGNWLPLTWLSLMLDCHLFGLHPGRMHLVNVVFHLVNTLLLFAVLKKMTGSLWPSAFVAAAFALHPMHVESVAWITERKDVLSTFFLLLTLAAYAGYVKRPSIFKYIASLILFALGLMSKPMLVTLPIVLLLLDYWPLNRLDSLPAKTSGRQPRKPAFSPDRRAIWYRMLIEKIPFFILAAVSSGITFIFQKAGGGMMDVTVRPLESRVANVFLSYSRYLGKLFWPQNLAVFYPFDAYRFSFRQIALCALLVFGISVLVICLRRTQRYLLVGWFWFVGTLIPVTGIIQSGAQAYADRYTYIPYIGLFIMAAWGLPELCSKWPYRKAALGITAALVLTALGLAAYRQTGYWNNSIVLFSHTNEVTKNNFIANNNLGAAYSHLCRWQEAVEAFKQAIQFKSDFAEAYYNLGVAYSNLGRWQEAMEACRQAIQFRAEYAEAHNNLGNAYANFGRWQETIEAYSHAIQIKPDFAEAYYNLGNTYVNLGRYQEAIEAYRQAIRLKPDYAKAHYDLANALLSEGNFSEAISYIKRSLEIQPDDFGIKNNLAWMLAVCPDPAVRNPSEAIRLAQEACTATNSMNPSLLDTLGVAYASAGRFAEAIETARTALTLVDAAERSTLKDDILYHLAFYTQGKPYIESAQKRPGDPNKP
ncbi:MAG: tetratricopeptide repeat protein [Planctomycetes bacterium]|nr:tetratricopeptide repeat protein [Planctomycetota bacterium]